MKELSNLNTAFAATKNMTKEQKKALDRESILEMTGRFHVTFDFAETFSPIENYEREGLYKNASIEYVFAIQNEANFISLQHILVIEEKFIVKHWRQDWVYEEQELLSFYKEGVWKKEQISKEVAEGTWTQKVYQVDDSPRYQGYGTWIYVDGKRYWESKADAPLPRRQEKRTDYNVLTRNSRIELTEYGWKMNQDNQKVYRDDNGNDKLIVWEKGFEIQNRGEYNCQLAIDYWENNQNFWADARAVWDKVIAENNELALREKVDNKLMYEVFFGLVPKFEGNKYDQDAVRSILETTVRSYLINS